MYPLILFDADDALFDFAGSQEISFRKTLEYYQIQDRFAELFQTYIKISKTLWVQIEKGEISKDFLKVHRFEKTFEIHQIALDPAHASELYLEMLPENVLHIAGAVEACRQLSQTARLAIVTNGVETVQKRRLTNSELRHWIEFMVISDECGYAKPDHRIFTHTLKRANHTDPSTVLMIGDRLETDIRGANDFGMKSCWFNPQQNANETGIQPHFEIRSFDELLLKSSILFKY